MSPDPAAAAPVAAATRPLRGAWRRAAVPAVLAAGVAASLLLAGCSSASPGDASASPSSSPAAPSSAATAGPSGSSASSPGATQGPQPPRTLVEGGVSITVPPGWNAASLDADSVQAAVAAQQDPQTAAFLSERLRGMAATGGLMYLYDLDDLDQGVLSAVEVYRYPGTDPGAVARDTIAPELEKAGLDPQLGTLDLPAGQASTVTGRLEGEGVALTNEVALLVVGPSVVSLSATFADQTQDTVEAVIASVQPA